MKLAKPCNNVLAQAFPLVVAAHSRESLHGAMSRLTSDRTEVLVDCKYHPGLKKKCKPYSNV